MSEFIMPVENPTMKQVVVVFQVDVRVEKAVIERAIEALHPYFKHPTAWDSLIEFLEDLPPIEWDADEDDGDYEPPIYGHA